jgi:hypothetical protein
MSVQHIHNAAEFQQLLTSTTKLVVVDFFGTWW